MGDTFQRLLIPSEPQVLSMNVQAALGSPRTPRRSQFSWLLRHFIERFFNHETASPDGDAKTRLVQIACAAGLPPFVIAIYLWPIYHPIKGWPIDQPSSGDPPPYWLQVNHHFFFVLYSFIAMTIATVFEWDLFFPDLLDLFVLGPLPIKARIAFLARVTAIALFTGGLLFDANLLSAFVLPMSMDPQNLSRFLAAHIVAAGCSGFFAAVCILALQGTLLSILGERLFRKLALFLQSAIITTVVMFMLLFPVLSGVVPTLLRSGSLIVRLLPPFWFLGLYQRILEGPAAPPIYHSLTQAACIATLAATLLAVIAYPIAYNRKMRQLVEGSSARERSTGVLRPLHHLLHRTILRSPLCRAVFHFISQTILRVPRYRIYLILYCGVGLAVVTATILRFTVVHQQVRIAVSPDGIRVATGIVIFWMIAGLRMAFASSGNQRGRWIFRVVHGNPPQFDTAIQQFGAARLWALLVVSTVTCAAWLIFRAISPSELLTWPATASQALVAVASCLLLTDAFFLPVTSIPFTSEAASSAPSLAFTVLKYFAVFPLVTALPLRLEPCMEHSPRGFLLVAALVVAAHIYLRHRHRIVVRAYCDQPALDDDEEDFPMKLGLRY
ncbi:MAG TPA: hypothetical protein VK716_00465 [Terracidiphilus sp.]|jgi:hypothetical protein|nr:hypothetical protein [Terracidiphilus sp.]